MAKRTNTQTGSFQDVATPNSLFGLGIEKISVPSTVSQKFDLNDNWRVVGGDESKEGGVKEHRGKKVLETSLVALIIIKS
uniref:Uncharacterized protein n=1 Tax=Solanum lycopersicum TaxID=4081 RepID=A0A3Q7F911_SOLLC